MRLSKSSDPIANTALCEVRKIGSSEGETFILKRICDTELKILVYLSKHATANEYVVKVLDYGKRWNGKPRYWAVMPKHETQEAFEACKPREQCYLIMGMLRCMIQVHEAGIYHDDTHIGNFVYRYDKAQKRRIVQMIDFGRSKYYSSRTNRYQHEAVKGFIDDFVWFLGDGTDDVPFFAEVKKSLDGTIKTVCKTLTYFEKRAPEINKEKVVGAYFDLAEEQLKVLEDAFAAVG